jgi:transposase
MAPRQKKRHRLKAHLAFLDETGMLMAPLIRRTWARKGQTPILRQRTNSYKKVSVIGALTVARRLNRVGFCFRLHPDANIDTEKVEGFLNGLDKHLPGPIVLLWDRFGPHKSRKMNIFLAKHPDLHPEFFPPYAPELNPCERVWSYLKLNPMANDPALQLDDLTRSTRKHARSVQRKESLLRGFLKLVGIPLRLR